VTPEAAGYVLLVEHDLPLRSVLVRHLVARGFRVVEAGSAEEAVTHLTDDAPPALVVLDLNLPGATGWELLRGPAFAAAGSPPVVITSATTISPRRLAEFHVAGYLPKPFAIETLVETVTRFTVHT
jgi:DNA-binding response OmpR family regulator